MSLRHSIIFAIVLAASIAADPTPAAASTCGKVLNSTESALGLTITDNGDGTWHYPLLAGASTSPVTGAHFTWVYDGQQNYPCVNPSRAVEGVVDDPPDSGDSPSGGRALLDSHVRVDKLGRRWRVDSIDHVSIDYAVADYWADVDSTIGLDLDPSPSPAAQTADGAVTSWRRRWQVPTVSSYTCSSAAGTLFDSESRSTLASTAAAPFNAAARVERFDSQGNSDGQCGGALIVDSKFVLTAAHCVDTYAANELVVRVGTSSFGVDTIHPNPDWPVGTNDFTDANIRNDFYVLELSATPAAAPMVLARDGRTAAGTRNVERVATDQFMSTGSCQQITTSTVVRHPAEQVRGTKNGSIRSFSDTIGGASGGPIFRVKSGQTVGRVLGVHSVISLSVPSSSLPVTTGQSWSGGPRVSEFEEFVIAVATD